MQKAYKRLLEMSLCYEEEKLLCVKAYIFAVK